jgi:hypothetical protein
MQPELAVPMMGPSRYAFYNPFDLHSGACAVSCCVPLIKHEPLPTAGERTSVVCLQSILHALGCAGGSLLDRSIPVP